MAPRRMFVDTVFLQAALSAGDQLHHVAVSLAAVFGMAQLWTTDAVLIELGNGLSASNRADASRFIESAYHDPNMHVVSVDRQLIQRARRLYAERPDKQWGMTDCISFIVMADYQITHALTADHHFEQAGFTILMK